MWYVDFYCYVRIPEANCSTAQQPNNNNNNSNNNNNNNNKQTNINKKQTPSNNKQISTRNKHQATTNKYQQETNTKQQPFTFFPSSLYSQGNTKANCAASLLSSHSKGGTNGISLSLRCLWCFFFSLGRSRGFFWWGKFWILKTKPSNPGYLGVGCIDRILWTYKMDTF